MSLQDIKILARKGMELYANKNMRKQWIRKHAYLMESGRHVTFNGKYPERIVH